MSDVTAAAARFIRSITYDDLPSGVINTGKRCVLDGIGLIVGGSMTDTAIILADDARTTGGRQVAQLLGHPTVKVPAQLAARVLGAAGHAMDWDDTQVTDDPEHRFGMLMHPTIPPLASVLAVSQLIGDSGGREFLLAFLTGFEIECKIAEWIRPDHYLRGMHTSGTIGTFGAFASSAKLLDLSERELRHGLGIAASMAAGIRCNYGSMTKALHVGRAAENGVTAALLAQRGFTADTDSLDGRWGFFSVHGSGATSRKLSQGFGTTWSIVSPGVSIKPYPCGVLTHPTLDLMRKLIVKHSLLPDEIREVVVYAGSNILDPIRFPIAKDQLQAKFCLPAQLAMIVLKGDANRKTFDDAFVASQLMQDMQARIRMEFDPRVETTGFNKLRSRLRVLTKDGTIIEDWADETYRGGPAYPLSNRELEDKVRSCCDEIIGGDRQEDLIESTWRLPDDHSVRKLLEVLQAVTV